MPAATGKGKTTEDAAADAEAAGEQHTDEQLADAEAAFNAYTEHAGGKTHDDKPIPAWADLGDDVRGHWVAGAAAVRARCKTEQDLAEARRRALHD